MWLFCVIDPKEIRYAIGDDLRRVPYDPATIDSSPPSPSTMSHIDVSICILRRALSRIANDCYMPIPASPEIPEYFDDLTHRFPDDSHPFNSFVLHLSVDALTDELISQSLPEQIRDSVLALRAEHHGLQVQKESEIARGIFDNARDYRDRQEELASALAELIQDVEFVATPDLINRALVSLGFDASSLRPQNEGSPGQAG